MKVRYLGETDNMVLTHGKEYPVIGVEKGWYRIETDLVGDYLFPPSLFEVTEEGPRRNADDRPV